MSFFNRRVLVLPDLGSGCGRALAFILLGVLASGEWSGGSAVLADEWPQWLGSQRDGTWAAEGIPESFPSEGPKLLWKQTIGGGYSGPAVSSGCVVVMDRRAAPVTGGEKFLHEEGEIPRNENFVRQLRPGKERVLCFRQSDGELLWQHQYDCPYSTVATYAIGPRSTPTIDGDHVYTLGAEGDLRCLKMGDGSLVWSRDFKVDYKVPTPNWGFASPPLVDGNRLICIVGGESSGCVAFDKQTGRELWRSLTPKEPGYSAPVIRAVAGRRQLLIWTSDALHGLDPENGKPFWSVPFPSTYAMSVATPQVLDDSIFIMCFNGKSCLIDVGADGMTAGIRWEGNRRTGIDGVHNTPQLVDGYAYGCGNGGRYLCVRLEDGKRMWQTFQPVSAERPIAWGNVFTVRLTAYQNRYVLINDQGEIIMVRMDPEGYTESDRVQLIKPTHEVSGRILVWSHPAFADGNIYLRNDEELRCYALKNEDPM
ncbi:MAG: PQQ-binding-like beta-propeller repeat protein [Planctomycetota bacterium]|nr:PQQ-binding-like beta-propeller repeat protein [Planctomycetota bacterium]